MKVLYLSYDYSPHDHRFLSAIQGSEHQAYYARLANSGRNLESRPIPEGVEVVEWAGGHRRFTWFSVPGLVLSFKRVLESIRPEIIQAGPIQTCGLVAALSGFHPLISQSWGFDLMRDADRNAWSRWVTRNVLSHSDWLFGDCQAVLDRASHYGFDLHYSTHFPWGIDLNYFSLRQSAALRRELGWTDAFVFFCNRSWEPPYGVDLVVNAFAQAARIHPEVRLLLLGRGSQEPWIREFIRKEGLTDRIVLPGQVSQSQLPEYYRSADVFISASHTDGSSVSLLEAMGCGLPVIVSDIPGNCEWVQDGIEGWIFPDGDKAGLLAAMLECVSNPEPLVEMGSKGRKRVESGADWAANQRLMTETYEKVIKYARKI